MNKRNLIVLTILLLSTAFFSSTYSYAAFPIVKSNIQGKQELNNQKLQLNAYQELNVKPLNSKSTSAKTGSEDLGALGIVSLVLGVVGWVAFGSGLGILMMVGALVTGIIGVGKNRKYKGMALAGLLLGALGILVILALILVLLALLK